MESKFYRDFKEDRHPHTNMQKPFEHVNAYCRGTLAKENFMNAVDMG
jgi:hypothetical protein